MEENSALRGGGAFGDFGAVVALDLLLGASHANVGINAREGENFKTIPNIWINIQYSIFNIQYPNIR